MRDGSKKKNVKIRMKTIIDVIRIDKLISVCILQGTKYRHINKTCINSSPRTLRPDLPSRDCEELSELLAAAAVTSNPGLSECLGKQNTTYNPLALRKGALFALWPPP